MWLASVANAGFKLALLQKPTGTSCDEVAESDCVGIIKDRGFLIRMSDLFANVRTRSASDENLNETLAQAFRSIEDSAKGSGSESDLRGLFDDVDVNATKLGNTVAERNAKLVKIMESIGDLPLDHGSAKIDAFGDPHLMTLPVLRGFGCWGLISTCGTTRADAAGARVSSLASWT